MRQKTKNLALMEVLHPRMQFTLEEERKFRDEKSGFEGENGWDERCNPRLGNCIILDNLCLQSGRFCQIDKLIIAPSRIYPCEVKNYGGAFVFQDGYFYNHQMKQRDNPFIQLARTEQLLREAMQGFHFEIESRVLMVNPTFQLHGSSLDMPMVQHGQLERFIAYIANDRQRLTGAHHELARHLRALHQTENPYEQLMKFDFGQLDRGVFCRGCEKKMVVASSKLFRCPNCGNSRSKTSIVTDSIRELQLLTGKTDVSSRMIHDWCDGLVSMRAVQRGKRR